MKSIITVLALTFSILSSAQTKIDVPIETKDPFTVHTWAYNEDTNQWGWYSVFESSIEHKHGWVYNRRVRVVVDRYDVLDCLFIRGFEDCADTTRVKIYGSFNKKIIKDSPDLRKKIVLNGKLQEFGTPIERPGN